MAVEPRPVGRATRTAVGLVIICLGVLLFLREMHVPAAREALHWFVPAALLVGGAILVLRPACTGHRFWGGMALAVGAFLTADRLGVPLPGDVWDFFWPALFVAAGALLVRRSFRTRTEPPIGVFTATPPTATPHHDAATISQASVFSSQEIRNTSAAFAGGTLTAVCGGCRVDLTGARTVPGGAVLEVAAVCAGIVVRVPAGWEIRSEVTPVLGGIYDKTVRTAGTAATGLLILRGAAIMGGIDVTN